MKRPFPMIRSRALTVAASLALLAGCAAVAPPMAPAQSPAEFTAEVIAAPSAEKCRRWYQMLDEAVEQGGTRDAGAARIAGFPQLRMDRFAASFKDALRYAPRDASPTQPDPARAAQRRALLDYLQDLDTEARLFELGNLPAAARFRLGLKSAETLAPMLGTCAAEMSRNTFSGAAEADSIAALSSQLTVPDQYADWKRILGLYALTSIPFLHGVEAWQQETARRFAQEAEREPDTASRYVPAPTAAGQTQNMLQRFAAGPRDELGIPQLSVEDWATLLAQYAPVFEIESGGAADKDSDRFGTLRFAGEGPPIVDADKPVAYRRIAFTRYRGQTLVQLVYGIWFPQRPAAQTIDLLAGRLDGVMIRITLDARGAPLLVDSIHACGCYHLFFPGPRLSPRPAPRDHMEWAFIPARLPMLDAGQRVQVRLAPSSHYLIDIRPFNGAPRATDIRYRLRDDNELRALPLPGGGQRSVFGSDGIIAGSERGERFLFWPMGIASPGAMRQWGTHATAFVGRRHFDDADLIEQRFDIKPD
ncbi:MAG TPA: hypothetical protein VF928_09110 [Usitatibacteraceae bacterium]